MPANLTPEQLAQLAHIDTPTISNAIEGFGVRPPPEGHMGEDVRCLTPELSPLVGFAVTATVCNDNAQRDPKARGIAALYEALAAAPKPAVVVFQDVSKDRNRSCHLGDGMSATFQRLGAVGAVTDGNARDLVGIRALGFRLFAHGLVASRSLLEVLQVNLPVTVSGARIVPGTLIHGDYNGVITIPDEIAGQVATAALQVRDKESLQHDFVLDPEFTLAGLMKRMAER